MSNRSIIAALLALGLAGCSRSAERPPKAEVRTDSVAGYRLGMSRDEVDSVARVVGVDLVCSSRTTARGAVVVDRCEAGENGARVQLMNGQVTTILGAPLGPQDTVSPPTLRARLEKAYGPASFAEIGTSSEYPYQVYWAGEDSSSVLELSCPDSTRAEGCLRGTRQVTVDAIRRRGNS